jgi:hypothetical protein
VADRQGMVLHAQELNLLEKGKVYVKGLLEQ